MSLNETMVERLYLLHLGTTPVSMGPGHTVEIALGCYLLKTNDGKNILIDSGMPGDVTLPTGVSMSQEKNVLDLLSESGLRPADIDILICTHFDIDHVGYHDAFSQAELIVQRTHYEMARGGHPRFEDGRAHWDHPDLRYRLIDGDLELLPGLTLLETSGHTTGHQSVLVRLPQTGPVLLVIDAVALQRLFTVERVAGRADENEEQLRASTQKLLDVVEREQVALTVFGHDGEQWKTLKKAPEFYE
jgi:N-acyl homoserine lactone hydrolase